MPGPPSVTPERRLVVSSVSGRVLLVTLVVWVGLLAGLHMVLSGVFRPTFARIESELLVKDLERVEAAVLREAEQLGRIAEDYASGDDMRAFVQEADGELPRALNRSILKTLDLDALFIFDAVGRVKYAQRSSGEGERETAREYTPQGFSDQFPVIASARAQGGAGGDTRRGLVRFSGGKLVFAAASSIRDAQAERGLGTLVLLRELDSAGVSRLGEQVRLPLSLRAADPTGAAVAASGAAPVVNGGLVSAAAWLRDPFGKPIARYSIEREASILGKGEETLQLAGVGSLFMFLLVLLLLLGLLHFLVVRPLRRLTVSMENVRRTGDLELRVGMHRADEIGVLAYNFDRLLALLGERTRVLEELATTDGLTRLANRRTVMERLAACLDVARGGQEPLSVLLLDVDHFKRINDTSGHSVGDRVLRQVADTIRKVLGPDEVAGRYGGEEFLILLPRSSRAEASAQAERLRLAVREQIIQGLDWPVTISVGVATWAGHTAHGLLATADLNLYRAKESGRDRVIAADVPLSRLPAASVPPPGSSSREAFTPRP